MNQILKDALDASCQKITANSSRIGLAFPHVAIEKNGNYNNEIPSFWTAGFWPGLLHLAYRQNHNAKLFELALDIEEAQDATLDAFFHLHHDVGFMWIPMSLAHYRETGSPLARDRALKASAILAGRFNVAGSFIRAWNDEVREGCQGWAIIDCMMNIPLLYWASKETKDPRYFHIAVAHADTVLTSFIRPDGTTPHIVEFDPVSGKKLRDGQGQGKAPESSWSRGQAWAIYGMALSSRETGYERYLDAAIKVGRTFFSRLPDNMIPFWDFDSDEKDQWAKDSSAAAIAASGFLEIAKLAKDEETQKEFTGYAIALLEALTRECADFSNKGEGIINLGTVKYTTGKHVNVPIIYGDFYYVEALQKLAGMDGLF